jgi:hypothetical protein
MGIGYALKAGTTIHLDAMIEAGVNLTLKAGSNFYRH